MTMINLKEYMLQQDRIKELEDAIKSHRAQKADDRCIEDDDRLYAVLKDGIKCDRRVGDKAQMLKNCQRFIERRCEAGGWPTYADLEKRIEELGRKSDEEMERVKACEHIAEGENGWEQVSNLCPSTAAVSVLRRNHDKLWKMVERLNEYAKHAEYPQGDPPIVAEAFNLLRETAPRP